MRVLLFFPSCFQSLPPGGETTKRKGATALKDESRSPSIPKQAPSLYPINDEVQETDAQFDDVYLNEFFYDADHEGAPDLTKP